MADDKKKTTPHPEYLRKGPLITEKMYEDADWPKILDIPTSDSSRPVRSTRNPNPIYVDAINRPWTASSGDIKWIQKSIDGLAD